MTFFLNNRSYFSFFFPIITLFFLGIYDDYRPLSPNFKLIYLLTAISITTLIDQDLVIKEIILSFSIRDSIYLSNIIELQAASQIFTILCFVLFINAFNMFDGINLQSGLYTLGVFIIFIYIGVPYYFVIFFSIPLIVFLLLNRNSQIFLGDSGTFIISYLIAFTFIKTYNSGEALYADNIFIIMLIPGIDLLRISIQRIINGNHPFHPDRSHLHHLLINRYSYISSLLIIIFLCFLPFGISIIFTNNLFSLIVSLIAYCLLCYKLQKNI